MLPCTLTIILLIILFSFLLQAGLQKAMLNLSTMLNSPRLIPCFIPGVDTLLVQKGYTVSMETGQCGSYCFFQSDPSVHSSIQFLPPTSGRNSSQTKLSVHDPQRGQVRSFSLLTLITATKTLKTCLLCVKSFNLVCLCKSLKSLKTDTEKRQEELVTMTSFCCNGC